MWGVDGRVLFPRVNRLIGRRKGILRQEAINQERHSTLHLAQRRIGRVIKRAHPLRKRLRRRITHRRAQLRNRFRRPTLLRLTTKSFDL